MQNNEYQIIFKKNDKEQKESRRAKTLASALFSVMSYWNLIDFYLITDDLFKIYHDADGNSFELVEVKKIS